MSLKVMKRESEENNLHIIQIYTWTVFFAFKYFCLSFLFEITVGHIWTSSPTMYKAVQHRLNLKSTAHKCKCCGTWKGQIRSIYVGLELRKVRKDGSLVQV